MTAIQHYKSWINRLSNPERDALISTIFSICFIIGLVAASVYAAYWMFIFGGISGFLVIFHEHYLIDKYSD
jgi:hypothetical protein